MTTAGPNLVGSGSSQGTGVAWSNTGNLTASDSTGATTSGAIKNNAPSAYLTGTGLGFSIPEDATINGIGMGVSAKDSSSLARISEARLTKDGTTAVGTNQASTSSLTTAFTTYNFGGISNLWGTTWAPADINASTFGGMLKCDTSSQFISASNVQVDWMTVTVYYTEASGTVSNQTLMLLGAGY